jgi:hypothetical protein
VIGRFVPLLRAIAARVCDAQAVEGVIDPTLADFRLECDEAVRHRRPWRRLWLHLALAGAFVQVIIVCAFERFCARSMPATAAERRSLGGVVIRCTIATAVALALFLLPPLIHVATGGWRMVIYLVPQAIPIAVPIGLTLGVFCSAPAIHASRMVVRQLALIAATTAVASFIIISWIVPAANQAFRELAFE